jgi:hypothetical protein
MKRTKPPKSQKVEIINLDEFNDDKTKGSYYDQANWLEKITTFELDALSPDEQLNHLEKEIIVRTKITQQEVFRIGEILVMAKKICQQGKTIGFEEWIRQKFSFSYDTANNLMNVFIYSFGYREVVIGAKSSVLYKIFAPSTTEELKEYLVTRVDLKKMTNPRLNEICQKYNQYGLDAVKQDIEENSRDILIKNQTNFTLVMANKALQTLRDLLQKIETRGGKSNTAIVDFETQIEAQQPEAGEINLKLWESITRSIAHLEEAIRESDAILRKIN